MIYRGPLSAARNVPWESDPAAAVPEPVPGLLQKSLESCGGATTVACPAVRMSLSAGVIKRPVGRASCPPHRIAEASPGVEVTPDRHTAAVAVTRMTGFRLSGLQVHGSGRILSFHVYGPNAETPGLPGIRRSCPHCRSHGLSGKFVRIRDLYVIVLTPPRSTCLDLVAVCCRIA